MENQEENKELIHTFTQDSKQETSSMISSKFLLVALIVVITGIGSGYLLSGKSQGGKNVSTNSTSGSSIEKGLIIGSDDTKTFKDTAEGKLEEGGVEGEGQFHLVRPGGESQNVYMTSSSVDLSQFIGRKIKVWGQTNDAKIAGWLMDVGRVEVLE